MSNAGLLFFGSLFRSLTQLNKSTASLEKRDWNRKKLFHRRWTEHQNKNSKSVETSKSDLWKEKERKLILIENVFLCLFSQFESRGAVWFWFPLFRAWNSSILNEMNFSLEFPSTKGFISFQTLIFLHLFENNFCQQKLLKIWRFHTTSKALISSNLLPFLKGNYFK